MTDFWHGISPAWVSLGAAVVVMFPGFGLFGPRDFAKSTSRLSFTSPASWAWVR